MDPADVDALTEFCRDRVGDQVRAVGHISEGDVVPTYMRDDLQRRYTEAELRGLEDAATGAAGAIAGMNTYNTSLGQSHGGLFVFEDAFMLLIPDRSGEAAYVSLDRSVSEGLSAFIKECRHELFSPGSGPADPGDDDPRPDNYWAGEDAPDAEASADGDSSGGTSDGDASGRPSDGDAGDG